MRLERLAQERAALERSLDDLGARLLVGQARVRFWDEMRERHSTVSAVACEVQGRHADAMAAHGARNSPPRGRAAAGRRAPAARNVARPTPASAPGR